MHYKHIETISTTSVLNRDGFREEVLYALCTDGTVWRKENPSYKPPYGSEWEQIKGPTENRDDELPF